MMTSMSLNVMRYQSGGCASQQNYPCLYSRPEEYHKVLIMYNNYCIEYENIFYVHEEFKQKKLSSFSTMDRAQRRCNLTILMRRLVTSSLLLE